MAGQEQENHDANGRWNWADAQQGLLGGLGGNVDATRKKVKSFWEGFIDFAARDNVLEVAVGLIIASSFTAVVNVLVSDILLPPISLIPGLTHRNLPEKFAVLRHGTNASMVYNTLEQAKDDGAVTVAYGLLLDKLFSFIGLGLVLYLIAMTYGALTHDNIIKHTVKCKYCKKQISQKAQRCYLCTSWVDGREDREGSAL